MKHYRKWFEPQIWIEFIRFFGFIFNLQRLSCGMDILLLNAATHYYIDFDLQLLTCIYQLEREINSILLQIHFKLLIEVAIVKCCLYRWSSKIFEFILILHVDSTTELKIRLCMLFKSIPILVEFHLLTEYTNINPNYWKDWW